MERQRIVRLVVKEILIGDDSIVIRHSIPIASTPPASGGGPPALRQPDAAPHRPKLPFAFGE
jgi:site-specific DNA recombinase